MPEADHLFNTCMKTKSMHTKKCSCRKPQQGEQDAVDDGLLPAAGLADDDGDVLVLSHRLDADLPWSQESRH